MKFEQGFVALISGSGSGIGRAVAVALASIGASISVLDVVERNGLETLELVKAKHEKVEVEHKPSAIFILCDVTRPDDVSSAFKQHDRVFNRLDACINCAGVAYGDFVDDEEGYWRRVIDVNLNGTIECTRLAIKAMRSRGQPGAIVNFASALGLYPAPSSPIYSASKGGVVLFTRSLVLLQKEGIRVNAVCPEFVETPLVSVVPQSMIDASGGFIPIEKVVDGVLQLIKDESRAGCCLWITNRHGCKFWPCGEEEKSYAAEALPIFSISIENEVSNVIKC